MQRHLRKKGKGALSEERIRRLVEIDFIWDAQDAIWDEMIAALVAYKNVHRDCYVPLRWPENPKLASWVNNLRRLRKKTIAFCPSNL